MVAPITLETQHLAQSIAAIPNQELDTCNLTRNGTKRDEDEIPVSEPARLSSIQTTIIMTCLCACVFVAALDITIVANALPTITNNFGSASGYTWIGSSYVLAHASTTPLWGKVSDIWGRKPILLLVLAIFFAGSSLCSFVETLPPFLAGRAVQGIGAAGLQNLVNICISDLFSLRDRGLYFGLTSVTWAFAAGIGPVLGGVFSQETTWRWCFYLNLPITGSVFLLLVFNLKLQTPRTPIWSGLKAIDWSGASLVLGGTLMLLLGLTFGGNSYQWKSATVICLICFGSTTWGLVMLNEKYIATRPIMPPRLFRTWSSTASFVVCFCHGFVFLGIAYYLPLYFQAVIGSDPVLSGVYLLPYVLSISFTAAITGISIQRTGKYIYSVYLGSAIMILGVGLLVDLDYEVNWVKLILYQLVAGIGVGLNLEGPLLAVQAAINIEDIAIGTTTFGFMRTMSSAISISVGGVVYANIMNRHVEQLVAVLGLNLAEQLLGGQGAAHVELIKSLTPDQRTVVRKAMAQSLRATWIMYVAFAGLGAVAGAFVPVHPLSSERKAVVLGLKVNESPDVAIEPGQRAVVSKNMSMTLAGDRPLTA
ncbi:MFS general substrate transporter [Cryphonectria parasitica EP155]|uniref:Efflux pump dotC n=1 Tax=Cryphonectria parasitica (strain ATCC 38755 / EP155) TaxID=660469 RepID=A0A9P5CS98_CRYP1|nr:MFS general substrate transporter [Cryphonectria parasitica EP155]KAF3768096.1 MFS general substrate transporter [Cryphonectria parasitica EP155]